MKTLFMVSLGGKVQGVNVEVHDVLFVVADHIDETIPTLKAHWFGQQYKLHMDGYTVIDAVGYYRIILSEQPLASELSLYFAHLGGYDMLNSQEQHSSFLCAATSKDEAKRIAMMHTSSFEYQGHVDHVVEVGGCLLSADGKPYYIALEKVAAEADLRPTWLGYRRLDLE